MIALFAVAICQYAFSSAVPITYSVSIEMNGTLPILGGKEGKASIEYDLRVTGLTPNSENKARAAYELLSFRTKMNGALLPFGITSVQDFFPKSEITYRSTGEVLSTTAPKKSLPASMPGLDSQKLPETTFMPIVFSEDPNWVFERTFNGGKIVYSASRKPTANGNEECIFSASQMLISWEDEANRSISSKDGATFQVDSVLTANGTATFDAQRNFLVKSETAVTIEGKAWNLKTKQGFHRKLTLLITCKLK